MLVKRIPNQLLPALAAALLLLGLSACNLPGAQPTLRAPSPTVIALPHVTQTTTPAAPTATPLALPSPTQTAPAAPTATPLALPSPTAPLATIQPRPNTAIYAVILVPEGDVLNVRAAPGPASPILESLPATAAEILLTGRSQTVDGQRWVEIERASEGAGWVNAFYLTESVTDAEFCADVRVTDLLGSLKQALVDQDGSALADLVSPAHGLNLQYLRGGTIASYSAAEAQWVFSSTYQTNWGSHPGSGLDVEGTFSAEVLPHLLEVFNANPTPACQTVAVGGTTYTAAWPPEYTNIHFVSLYKPGSAGVDLDWRTWLVGIEYVEGQPYLFALNHLQWEP